LPCPYIPVSCGNIYNEDISSIWLKIQNDFYKNVIKHNFCPARDINFVNKIQKLITVKKPYVNLEELK